MIAPWTPRGGRPSEAPCCARFTIFAPDDDAFAKVDVDALSDAELVEILLYHVVAGEVYAANLTDGMNLTTLQGQRVEISLDPAKVNGATVTSADVGASNGVVHLIDAVLVPKDDIAELASDRSALSSLVDALVAADLVTALEGDDSGPFTVFAPSNAAFEAVDVDALSATELSDILLYHVVAGAYAAEDLEDGTVLTTLQGQDLTVSLGDPVAVTDTQRREATSLRRFASPQQRQGPATRSETGLERRQGQRARSEGKVGARLALLGGRTWMRSSRWRRRT